MSTRPIRSRIFQILRQEFYANAMQCRNVPLESIHLLFEGNIIKGCLKDTIPRYARAKTLQHHHVTDGDADLVKVAQDSKGSDVRHIEEA